MTTTSNNNNSSSSISSSQQKLPQNNKQNLNTMEGPNKLQQPQQQQHQVQVQVPRRRQLIGAIDQGTSSTRFLVFENGTGQLIASSQIEISRIVPKEGWVEIDPASIMESVYSTIESAHQQLSHNYSLITTDSETSSPSASATTTNSGSVKLECIGICNQRESTVVWDSVTGEPLYNVIVWMDNRTKDLVDDIIDSVPGRDFNWLKDKTGLPMSTYFSAFKLKWLIDNVEAVKQALKENRLLFGTVDTWILWNLTGNHLTDVTNASRTFLMDIETLNWDKSLCNHFGIPMNILPKILSSADDFGLIKHGPLRGLPITGVIGDQSAALFGHNCLQLGQTKATFGTGCFIMQNIGPGPLNGALSGVQREAKRGLITTVGYKLRDKPASYALEGSIKIAGAALTWLRDNIELIRNYDECDQLVNMTSHSAGVFFVPALGGLYSPYWDPNAAGLYIGLSQFSKREHLVRATFDSIAFQTNDILSLMRGVTNGLMIDGGLCKSDNMCQILADITGCDIVRPSMCETSALGAAMVAGCGADIWQYDNMLASSNINQYEYSSSSNQNHHYPHESLHYESKFSSLIHSRAFSTHQTPVDSPTIRQSPQQRLAGFCYLDAGGGVNDDAGGGLQHRPSQPEAVTNNCLISLNEDRDDTVSSSKLTSTSEDDEDEAIVSGDFNNSTELPIMPINNQVNNVTAFASESNANQKLRCYATPSSGYSSGDNFEQANNCEDVIHSRESPVTPSQLTTCAHSANNNNSLEQTTTTLDVSHSQVKPRTNNNHNNNNNNNENENNKQLVRVKHCKGAKTSATTTSTSTSSYLAQAFSSNLPTCLRNYICPQTSAINQRAEGCLTRGYEADNYDDVDDIDGDDDEEDLYDDDYNPTNAYQRRDQINAVITGGQVKPVDVFQSYISLEHRTELVNTWRLAVERSMKWTKIHHEEIRRIDYQRLASLPISMYLFFSIGTVALSGLLSACGK